MGSEMQIGGIRAQDLVHEFGTPLYCIDTAVLDANIERYVAALATYWPSSWVAYAGKAGMNRQLLQRIASKGLGVDVVSEGELETALNAGVPTHRILFHGNNKLPGELVAAITNSVCIIVDHIDELTMISTIASELNRSVRIMVRMKPEIEAHTHDYIKTGHIDSKFGIDQRDIIPIVHQILMMPNITLIGIHCHIGSQIFDLVPYQDLVKLMVGYMATIRDQTGLVITTLNIGGGVGVVYTEADDPPPIDRFVSSIASALKTNLSQHGLQAPTLIMEPGRSIVATAGTTLYTIGAIKTVPHKTYLFIDGGMADNIRPLLYGAQYHWELATKMGVPKSVRYAIAGRYCESGDILGEDILLPPAEVGDIVATLGTGAYHYALASNYNRTPRPPVIAVDQGKAHIWVRRESIADVLQYDV